MIRNNYNVNFPETLNLAVLGSAVSFIHLGPQTTIMAVGVTLNGTTISSAADVEVEIAIAGGAVLGVISLPTLTTAGTSVFSADGVTAIPANTTLTASVIVAATVAAGSGSVTLSLSNG